MPAKEIYIIEKTIGKVLEVGINTPEFYGYSQQQKTEEFKEKYKKRAYIEWKNGEMKNFHGLDRVRGYGLKKYVHIRKVNGIGSKFKEERCYPWGIIAKVSVFCQTIDFDKFDRL